MKTKSISKIALLLVLCLTVICAIGIAASAEETPVCKIDSANVAYNDMLQLAFTLEATDALPEGAELGIIAWEDGTTDFTVATAYYATFTSSEKDGYTYFKTRGIPAPDMDTPIYVAACYRVGEGDIVVAETPFKYSALQYAGSRLTASNVTANQAKLYEDTITYGMASDTVLEGNENYAFVRTVNGTVGSAGATIGGWLNKEVLLRAEAKNADGEYFIKWVDAEGDTISTDRLAYVTVESAGITEYTAVYGAAADSAYADVYDFEQYSIGACSALSGAELGLNSGLHKYYITESLSGDKQLKIDRLMSGSGYYATFFAPTDKQVTAFECDIEFHEILEKKGVHNNVNLYLKDKNGATARVRINFSYVASDTDYFTMYLESKGNTTIKNDAGKAFSVMCPKDSTVTLKFAIDLSAIREVPVEVVTAYKKDADGNYLDAEGNIITDSTKYVAESTATYTTYTTDLLVYGNGKYLGKIDIMEADKVSDDFGPKAKTFNSSGVPSFILDDSCTLTGKSGLISLSTATKDVSVDNIIFFDEYDK